MIKFEPIASLPPDVPDKALEQAKQSLCVWSARYVPLNDDKDHTELGIFGFVPTDYLARRGYFWLTPRAVPMRKVLIEAKLAFSLFVASFPWTTFVYTEMRSKKNARFARFMGYHAHTETGGYLFHLRDDNGH